VLREEEENLGLEARLDRRDCLEEVEVQVLQDCKVPLDHKEEWECLE
jgi:hypothetical protein